MKAKGGTMSHKESSRANMEVLDPKDCSYNSLLNLVKAQNTRVIPLFTYTPETRLKNVHS